MPDLGLQSFNKLYPMMIRKYQDLVVDQNASEKDKINSIIQKLNALGKLSNDVVRDWNTVYNWAMNDGLNTDVSNKLEEMRANGEISQLLQNIFDSLVGDMTTLHTTAKDTFVNVINEVDDLAKENQTAINTNTTNIATNTANITQLTSKTGWIDVTQSPYNIKGDGSYETTKLQNAFNDGVGKTIYVPDNLTITIGTTVYINSNSTLIFGQNSKILAGSTFSGSPILGNNDYITLFTNVNPSQAVNIGDTMVYLPNVTGITAGMILKITTSKTVASNQYNVGELLRIKSVDTTAKTVTVNRPIRNAYTTSHLVDIVQPSKNIKLIDVVVDSGDKTKNLNAIRFSHVQNCYVYRSKTLTGGLNGIELDTCFDSKVEDSYIEKYDDVVTVSGRRGYGIALTGLNLLGRRNTITGCKHAMTSADRIYISDHVTFEDNYAYDFTDSWAFDFHGNVFNGKMINNAVENAWGGIGIRCQGGKAINNNLKNTTKPITIQEYGMVDTVIKDNRIDGFSDNGVMIYGAYLPLSHVKIQNNKFYNQTAGSFIIETGYDTTVNGDGIWIDDNIFENFTATTAIIHLYQIGKAKIKNNSVNNSVDMSSFIRIRPKTYSKYNFEIMGNRVTGTNFNNYMIDVWNEGGLADIFTIGDNQWNITSSTSKSIYNNIVDGTPTATLKSVRNDYRKDKNAFYTYGENQGTANYQGDGTSTSKTIAHGLGAIPTAYNVLPITADAGTAGVKYVTADATNLTVYFNSALPTASFINVKFSWRAKL